MLTLQGLIVCLWGSPLAKGVVGKYNPYLNPYKEKFRIWCSATDMYMIQNVAEDGYSKVYEWTPVFTKGMKFPESELGSMSSVLMGTYVPKNKNTFRFEVVGQAILDTGESLRYFYLIPIEVGFGMVEKLL